MMQRNTGCLIFIFLLLGQYCFSQKKDSAAVIHHVSGAIGVTSNGISIVPSFSLNKPAVQLNLTMGQKRLSFEPDIRFSLAGKPWSMLFWGRYKIITGQKFNMNAGAHLGLNFKTAPQLINGETVTTTIARRYAAGEIFPRYTIAKNIQVGIYYLYSHGLDAGTIGNTHFITVNTNISDIKIAGNVLLKLNPQLYYLKLDAQDGYYITNTLTLIKKHCPLSVSSTINKKINSNIAGSKSLLWNAGVVYSFN